MWFIGIIARWNFNGDRDWSIAYVFYFLKKLCFGGIIDRTNCDTILCGNFFYTFQTCRKSALVPIKIREPHSIGVLSSKVAGIIVSSPLKKVSDSSWEAIFPSVDISKARYDQFTAEVPPA